MVHVVRIERGVVWFLRDGKRGWFHEEWMVKATFDQWVRERGLKVHMD